MKKKGFTLVELLVVIAIIAMLLAILMPALNKVKRLAQRLVCTTNLKGMGTALVVYANDFEDEYAIQGGGFGHTWAEITGGWQNSAKNWSNPDDITTGASLFLLVREADVSPKSFVCKSSDQKAYDGRNGNDLELVELWDFGRYTPGDAVWAKSGPRNHVSYSYQIPYDVLGTGLFVFPPDAIGPASMALMADRNPWFDVKLESDAATLQNYPGKVNPIRWNNADKWRNSLVGNSEPHNREGQNVLYNDGHAEFEKRSDIGYDNDNIYTYRQGPPPNWNENQIRNGAGPQDRAPGQGTSYLFSKSNRDTVLVNDVDVDATP